MLVALLICILTKFLFGRLAKARGIKPCQKHTIRGLRPKLRRDWKHENESKSSGIFKEISGFLGSSRGICTKLQLATLVAACMYFYFLVNIYVHDDETQIRKLEMEIDKFSQVYVNYSEIMKFY